MNSTLAPPLAHLDAYDFFFSSSSFLAIRLPFSSLGMRSQPVLNRFLLGSNRGKGCASVLKTI